LHGTAPALQVERALHLGGHEASARLLLAAPVALTVIAFFTVRAMARTALHLDDIEAARRAAEAARAAAEAARLPATPWPG
jgi:hypothetical protein